MMIRFIQRLLFLPTLLSCIWLTATYTVLAQNVGLTIADTSIYRGETILLPVTITGADADSTIMAGEFTFSYNPKAISLIDIIVTGTLLDGESVTTYVPGAKIAFALSSPIDFDGILLYLKFKAKDNAEYFKETEIAFSEVLLNEGTPEANTTNGSIRIKGISIQPAYIYNNLIVGDSLYFSAAGDTTGEVIFSTSDQTIGIVDESNYLRVLKSGFIRVLVEDEYGLKDSTNQFKTQPLTFNDFTISVPDTSVTETLTILLPVNVSEMSGLGILSASGNIHFNTYYFEYIELVTDGAMLGDFGSFTKNETNASNGVIGFAAADDSPLSGSGVLIFLKLRAKRSRIGASTVYFSNLQFNEDLTPAIEDGIISVMQGPYFNVFPENPSISMGDTLTFSLNSNGKAPFTWSAADNAILSINSTTGFAQGLFRGLTEIIATDANGFTSLPMPVRVNDFTAFIDSAIISYPDTVWFDIKVRNLSPYSILSAEGELRYDTTAVRFSGFKLDSTQTQGSSIQYKDTLGIVTFALASTAAMGGDNLPLAKLGFYAAETAVDFQQTSILFQKLLLNEPSATTPTVTTRPGLVTIYKIDPPGQPVLLTPLSEQINVDPLVTFQWTSTERAERYHFQLAEDSAFTSILADSTAGTDFLTYSHPDSLQYDSTYFWRLNALNRTGSSGFSTPVRFTIMEKPNDPPLLVSRLPDLNLLEDFEPFFINQLDTLFRDDDLKEDEILTYSAQLDTLILETVIRNDTLHIKPLANRYGPAHLYLSAIDPDGGVTTDTLLVTITPVNDPPIWSAIPDTAYAVVDSTLILDLRDYLDDADHTLSELTIEAKSSSESVLIEEDGDNIFSFTSEIIQTTVISLKATDPEGLSDSVSFVLIIEDGVAIEHETLPNYFRLDQNYPNPFNPSTNISFELPEAATVSLRIYNLLGQEVAVLANGKYSAGQHNVLFQSGNLSSGIYIYRLETGKQTATKKMILIK